MHHPEFPRLPPLPPGELYTCPPSHAALAHLERTLFETTSRTWLLGVPGAGKSALLACLAARHGDRIEALRVRTLADAARHVDSPRPLLVELDEPGADDEAALARFGERRGRTCVLAPFAPPARLCARHEQTVGADPSRHRWHLLPIAEHGTSWRGELAARVASRLREAGLTTRLEPLSVRRWLAEYDPSGCLVATPGDLFALAADFDRHGDDGAPYAVRAARWLDDVISPALAASLRRLLGAHLFDPSSSLGGRSARGFAALAERQALPESTVPELVRAGLLRQAAQGLVGYPAWVAHGVMVAQAKEALAGGALPEAWGALAADASRRAVLDGALDELPDEALLGRVEELAAREVPETLAALGALEALFAATARRVSDPRSRLPDRAVPAVQRLIALQDAAAWEVLDDASVYAFTRQNYAEWLATHWALSFAVPPPTEDSIEAHDWEVPGWKGSLSLGAVSPWVELPALHPDGRQRREGCAYWMSLLADRVVARLEPPAPTDRLPELLAPALLRAAPSRGWNMPQLAHRTMAAPAEPERRITSYTLKVRLRGECLCPRCREVVPCDAAVEVAAYRSGSFGDGAEVEPAVVAEALSVAWRRGERELPIELARYAWRRWPAEALAIAQERVLEPEAEAWFSTAPRAELVALVRRVEGLEQAPGWAEEWSQRRAIHGGEAAEALYRLARREA